MSGGEGGATGEEVSQAGRQSSEGLGKGRGSSMEESGRAVQRGGSVGNRGEHPSRSWREAQ